MIKEREGTIKLMKLLSWNIYFDDVSGKTRYPKILNYLSEIDADIVTLQEVTPYFQELLLSSLIPDRYTISNLDQRAKYKNLILSKHIPDSFTLLDLPSSMDRKAPRISVHEGGKNLNIYSLHLESLLDDTDLRLEQIEFLNSSFDLSECHILCGDMNFGDKDRENLRVRELFLDGGGNDLSFTFDIERNELAKNNCFENESSRRLDRFLCKGKHSFKNYKVLESDLSDHFPILVELN